MLTSGVQRRLDSRSCFMLDAIRPAPPPSVRNAKPPTMTKTWPPIWMKGRPNILSAEILSKIKGALERGPVFGYHSIYCGGCSLNTWVFKAFEDFAGYLQLRAQAGDLFTVWSVHQLLERNLHLFSGEY